MPWENLKSLLSPLTGQPARKRVTPSMRAATPQDIERDRLYQMSPEAQEIERYNAERDPVVVASGYKPEDARLKNFMATANDLLSLYTPGGGASEAMMNPAFIKDPSKIGKALSKLKFSGRQGDSEALLKAKVAVNDELLRMQQNPHGRRRIMAHYAGTQDAPGNPAAEASVEPATPMSLMMKSIMGDAATTGAPAIKARGQGGAVAEHAPTLAYNFNIAANRTGDPARDMSRYAIRNNLEHETRHLADEIRNPMGREIALPGGTMKKKAFFEQYIDNAAKYGYSGNPLEHDAQRSGAVAAMREFAKDKGIDVTTKELTSLAPKFDKNPLVRMYRQNTALSSPQVAGALNAVPRTRPKASILDAGIEEVLHRQMKRRGSSRGNP